MSKQVNAKLTYASVVIVMHGSVTSGRRVWQVQWFFLILQSSPCIMTPRTMYAVPPCPHIILLTRFASVITDIWTRVDHCFGEWCWTLPLPCATILEPDWYKAVRLAKLFSKYQFRVSVWSWLLFKTGFQYIHLLRRYHSSFPLFLTFGNLPLVVHVDVIDIRNGNKLNQL